MLASWVVMLIGWARTRDGEPVLDPNRIHVARFIVACVSDINVRILGHAKLVNVLLRPDKANRCRHLRAIRAWRYLLPFWAFESTCCFTFRNRTPLLGLLQQAGIPLPQLSTAGSVSISLYESHSLSSICGFRGLHPCKLLPVTELS